MEDVIVSSVGNGSTTWVSSKNELLMSSLTKFFSNQEHIRKVLPVLQGKSNISLRVLDWFVTNYCKKQNVSVEVQMEGGESKRFMIYLDYKSQLKAYSKKQFDPFCRRERIRFVYGPTQGQDFITTVGQLNFFRWMISNSILDYVENHLDEIENDMNTSIRNHASRKWSQYPTYETWNQETVSSNTPESSNPSSEHEEQVNIHLEEVQLAGKYQMLPMYGPSLSTVSSSTSVPLSASVSTSASASASASTSASASASADDIHHGRKKRQELSINATKTVNKHNVTILVEFN